MFSKHWNMLQGWTGKEKRQSFIPERYSSCTVSEFLKIWILYYFIKNLIRAHWFISSVIFLVQFSRLYHSCIKYNTKFGKKNRQHRHRENLWQITMERKTNVKALFAVFFFFKHSYICRYEYLLANTKQVTSYFFLFR